MEQLLAGALADTHFAANRLIDEFGSLSAAIAGSRRRQQRAVGCPSAVARLRAVRSAMLLVAREDAAQRPLLANCGALATYLELRLKHETREHLHVVFLDRQRRLIHDETMWSGSTDEAPVYIQPLLHRTLDLGAAGIVLAHNHPSGDPEPSAADRSLTVRLASAARMLDIHLLDHLIISRSGSTSMRAMGLL